MKLARWQCAGVLVGLVFLPGALSSQLLSLRSGLAASPSARCEWSIDDKRVPHIRSIGVESPDAVYRCWGWLHAHDRAWQMEHLRRIALGRQSEVFGSDTIRADFLMRMLGLAERAQLLFTELSPSSQQLLQAYSEGVNQVFQHELDDRRSWAAQASPELRELHIRPEPWLPWHSLAIVLLQSFDQTRRGFEREFFEANLKSLDFSQYGQTAASEAGAEVPDLPWETSILKPGEYLQRPRQYRKPRASKATAARPPAPSSTVLADWQGALGLDSLDRSFGPTADSKGSNSWVLSAEFSQSGHAWLANDPHLKLNTPPIWHWAHLDSGSWEVIGGSLPGLPLVASGASRQMAWGMTNSYLDVADLQWVPPDKLEGKLESFRPLIWVRLWGPVRWPFFFKSFQRVQATGEPVFPLEDPEGSRVSGRVVRPPRLPVLHWTGFELHGSDIDPMFQLAQASSVEEFDGLVQRLGVPSWNFVFADVRGGIGYRANGRVPKRSKGATSGYVTQDFPMARLMPDEMPHVLKPVRGFVVTANNRQWPTDAVLEAGKIQVEGFRALRIEEALRNLRPISLKDQQFVQCDVQAVDARFFLPVLRSLLSEPQEESDENLPSATSAEQRAWELLQEWADEERYQTHLACRACAIYRRWMARLESQFTPDLPTLYRLLMSKLSHSDTSEVRAVVRKVRESFRATADELAARNFPAWSELHLNAFDHLAGARVFPTSIHQWVPTPGDEHSVNPGSSDWDARTQRFLQHSGASHRLLVELANPPRVYARLSGQNRPESLGENDRTVAQAFAEGAKDRSDWAQCDYDQRVFPFDWAQARLNRKSLIQEIATR